MKVSRPFGSPLPTRHPHGQVAGPVRPADPARRDREGRDIPLGADHGAA